MRHGVRLLSAATLVAVTAALAGCGGSSAGGTPGTSGTSPSASAPESPAPSISSAPPTAPEVPGYTLEPAPDGALSSFQQLANTAPDVYTGVSAFSVLKDGDDVGGLIRFGVDTTGTDPKTLPDLLVQSFVSVLKGSGDVSTEKVSGVEVVWTESGESSASAIWYQDSVLNLVIGATRDELTPFVTAAIKAG